MWSVWFLWFVWWSCAWLNHDISKITQFPTQSILIALCLERARLPLGYLIYIKPKIHLSFTFYSIFLSMIFQKSEGHFWQRVHRWNKWNLIWKEPSGGRAEIENVNCATGAIFNFNSATKGCFSNPTSLLSSMDYCSKNCPSDSCIPGEVCRSNRVFTLMETGWQIPFLFSQTLCDSLYFNNFHTLRLNKSFKGQFINNCLHLYNFLYLFSCCSRTWHPWTKTCFTLQHLKQTF